MMGAATEKARLPRFSLVHGTIRLCTLCCKHALICCGMSRTHAMIIYNILLNSSRGFLLISYFKRFLCRHIVLDYDSYNSEG